MARRNPGSAMGRTVRQLIGRPDVRFATAALAPALLLSLGAFLGGGWAFLGFASITLFPGIADRLARRLGLDQATDPAVDSERVALLVGALHFPLLALVLFALSGGTGLGPFGWAFTFLGFGLWFGQVSNATAHELIHRSTRLPFRLGMWIYISLLYGHHTSAHRLVHHRFAATPDDPNSAARGESFFQFLIRAWPGEFMAGYEMENSLRAGQARKGAELHPYTVYLAGGAAFLLLAGFGFGPGGLLSYLLLCAHTHIQLLLSDYVQHYGLVREKTGMDEYEPIGPEHSWDAPDLFSGLMLLNAPRHADHHLHPARPFDRLVLSPDGRTPLLPASLPVMATVALVPPVWQRMMDRRVIALEKARRRT